MSRCDTGANIYIFRTEVHSGLRILLFFSLFLIGHVCGESDLVEGTSKVDRNRLVQVWWNNSWTSLCSDNFDEKAARVVCRRNGTDSARVINKDYKHYGRTVVLKVYCTGKETDPSECQYQTSLGPNETCYSEAFVYCFNKTDIGTYTLSEGEYGRIELERNGQKGFVCDESYFFKRDASSFCRQAGFVDGDLYPMPPLTQAGVHFWINDINCNYNEDLLDACTWKSWKYRDLLKCYHGRAPQWCLKNSASVVCYKSLRLHTQHATSFGILLQYKDNTWYAYCADGFTMAEATVMCKELGYPGADKIFPHSAYAQGYWNIADNGLSCPVWATSLKDCTQPSSGGKTCRYGHYAAVSCTNPNTTTDKALENTSKLDKDGRVLVMKNGIWGSVCSDGFDTVEATVVCRHEGMQFGRKVRRFISDSQLPRWMFKVDCNGTETELMKCKHQTTQGKWQYCSGDAFVQCYNQAVAGTYTLTNLHFGHVKLTLNNQTGYVCNQDDFYQEDAKGICQEMGYEDGKLYPMPPVPLDSMWWVSKMRCRWMDGKQLCLRGDWKLVVSVTTYDERNKHESCRLKAPSVFCYNKIQLHQTSSGIVLQKRDRYWNALCAENFTMTEANIICREFGYGDANTIIPYTAYAHVRFVSIGNYGLSCGAGVTSLKDCTQPKYQLGYCAPGHFAALSCIDPQAPSNGIESTKINTDGRVMVRKYGVWGSVCVDGFDQSDASVVCKTKGKDSGTVVNKRETNNNRDPRWMFRVECSGTESDVVQCKHQTPLQPGETCSGDAHVYCFNQDNIGNYTLTHGWFGRVHMEKEGIQGYVCDRSYFSDDDAATICRQKSFAGGEVFPMPHLYLTDKYWWLNKLECNRGQNLVDSCVSDTWKYERASTYHNGSWTYGPCYSGQATVFCYGAVRLNSPFLNSSGLVLQWKDNTYWAFCADGFTQKAADLVCREIGFSSSDRILSSSNFSQESYTIAFNLLSCPDGAKSFFECQTTFDTANTCSYRNYAAISCVGLTFPEEPKKENESGKKQVVSRHDIKTKIDWDGRVLVFMHGLWGSVSEEDWDDADAKVVCRQKNMEMGKAVRKRRHRDGPCWIYNVKCKGQELGLQECEYATGRSVDSYENYDAFVHCYNTSDVGNYSLSNGHYGRLMVERNGQKAYICNKFTSGYIDAHAVCRSMGFTAGTTYEQDDVLPASTQFWESTIDENCVNYNTDLDVCVTDGWRFLEPGLNGTNGDCNKKTISVFCFGEVRLSGRPPNSFGVVLGYWGNRRWPSAYCADGFNSLTADLVCKKLGFTGRSMLFPAHAFYHYSYSSTLIKMNCSEGSLSLDNCTSIFLSRSKICASGIPAAVSCTNSDEPPPEKPDGSVMVEENGRVLVMKHGIWGTIFSGGWGDADAKVVCKATGFDSWKALRKISASDMPMWYYNVNCTGDEERLSDCPYDTKLSKCTSGNCIRAAGTYLHGWGHAYVYCFNKTDANTYSLTSGHYGRVQVEHNGQKALLCDESSFGYYESSTICRSLGFEQGEVYTMHPLSAEENRWWKASISCRFHEPTLDICVKGQWQLLSGLSITKNRDGKTFDCRKHTASVFCFGKVRLNSPPLSSTGIVLATESKMAYCAEGFGSVEANLVCKALGFTGISKVLTGSKFGSTYIFVGLKLMCPQDAQSLDECKSERPSDKDDCSYRDFAAVSCTNGKSTMPEPNGSVKIDKSGRVMVMHQGVWGTVSSRGWDNNDAQVACKHTNTDSSRAVLDSRKTGDKPQWIFDVKCNGTENSLMNCPHINSGTCDQIPDAYVNCYNKTEDDQYSLSHGSYGRLQLTQNGKQGYVCSQDYSNPEYFAKTVCKTLGYADGKRYTNMAQQLHRTSDLWWKNVIECRNEESHLDMCLRDTWQLMDGSSESETANGLTPKFCQSHPPAVICFNKVRLSGFTNSSGVVLHHYKNRYVAICADEFNDFAASLVCMELGYDGGKKLPAEGYSRLQYDIQISRLSCPNNASSLNDCQKINQTNTNRCIPRNYAAVLCLSNDTSPTITDATTSGVRDNATGVTDKVTHVTSITSATDSDTGLTNHITGMTHNVTGVTVKLTDVTDIATGGTDKFSTGIDKTPAATYSVTGVTANVTDVTNKVTDVSDKITSITDKGTGMTDKVTGVTHSVTGVTNKATDATDIATGETDRITSRIDRTSAVTDSVTGVTANVTDVTNKVTDVSDKMTSVTDKGTGMTDKVTGVTHSVTGVANKATDATDIATGETDKFTSGIDRTSAVTDSVTRVTASVTYVTDNVTDVSDKMINVTDKSTGMTDKVTGVTDNVTGVTVKVTDVMDNVTDVSNKVSSVTDRGTNMTDKLTNVTDPAGTNNTTDAGVNHGSRGMPDLRLCIALFCIMFVTYCNLSIE